MKNIFFDQYCKWLFDVLFDTLFDILLELPELDGVFDVLLEFVYLLPHIRRELRRSRQSSRRLHISPPSR